MAGTPAIWITSLVAMNLLWAGSYVVVKVGLFSLDPLALIFWRFAVAGAILVSWVAIRRTPVTMRRRDALRILLAGVMLGLSNWLWVSGINLSNASDASLLYVFEPIWGILLASIILRERVRPTTIAGLLLVLVGLAALSNFDLAAFGVDEGGVGLGNLLVILGLVCEGFFSIILKPMTRRVPATVTTAGVLVVALVVIAVAVAARGELPSPTGTGAFLSIGYLAVVCTVIGYTLWVEVMKHVPVGVMLFTIFIQPVVGPFIAWAALGEAIDRRIITGGALLLGGMLVTVIGHIRANRRDLPAVADDAIEIVGNV